MTIDAVRPIEDEAALRACFPVMHQLRPHLADADELVARWRRQVQDGYRLIAVWRDGVPVALAGYRQQENLVYGPFLYVDDLVTDANLRSSGLGNVLMSHLKA
ncbi:UNVERIFIED_CONTAM: GCN5 family acetyltransferase, partial [Mumia flava]